MECDLSSLDSVYAFAKTFKAEHGDQLDVLVNNGEQDTGVVVLRRVEGCTEYTKRSCHRYLIVHASNDAN